MSRARIQTFSAVAIVALGAGIVWAFSGLDGARQVHPRFPLAMQLYGCYLILLAPLALMPTPLPALGRLGLWNALGLGVGGLVIGAERSGALLALPLVCLGIALALWPPVPHPERDLPRLVILAVGGLLAALLPAAWSIWT
jgi:hypothetical protein